jgi:DNA (cytosine-5)-methyltransferase 1
MNGLDLFSGIGGLSLALEPWVRPIAYCENDRYAQAVLLSRMRSGELATAPIWDDVSTLQGDVLGRWIDIIYGGFPCQDISVAGRGAGLEGERSGLFLHVARLAKEIEPTFIFLENVPAIRTRGLGVVIEHLAGLGFDCRWTTVSAAEVGAPHLRKRWFMLAAHAERVKLWQQPRGSGGESREGRAFPGHDGAHGTLADASCVGRAKRRTGSNSKRSTQLEQLGGKLADSVGQGLEGPGHAQSAWKALAKLRLSCECEWPQGLPKPAIRRGDDGLSHRSHRLHGLGNSVVPVQARQAFQRLLGIA